MLISTLPFEYAVLLDPGDRIRRTWSHPNGSRTCKSRDRNAVARRLA